MPLFIIVVYSHVTLEILNSKHTYTFYEKGFIFYHCSDLMDFILVYKFQDYRLRTLQTELACGTSALVALIHQARLYIANVGDSRALLCTTDNDGILNIVQLSQGMCTRTENLNFYIHRFSTVCMIQQRMIRGLFFGPKNDPLI